MENRRFQLAPALGLSLLESRLLLTYVLFSDDIHVAYLNIMDCHLSPSLLVVIYKSCLIFFFLQRFLYITQKE